MELTRNVTPIPYIFVSPVLSLVYTYIWINILEHKYNFLLVNLFIYYLKTYYFNIYHKKAWNISSAIEISTPQVNNVFATMVRTECWNTMLETINIKKDQFNKYLLTCNPNTDQF